MSFLNDVIFPDDISLNSVGGPSYSTQVVMLSSGYEVRNINWSESRHTFDVGYGVRNITDLENLIDIFHVANGMAHSFRYKDWAEYKSCGIESEIAITDQTIATADGVETDFQLIKTYIKNSNTETRDITKPIQGTVIIEVDGAAQTETTDYTIDYTTGIVTFVSPPTNTHVIKAGYAFHVPVRFNTDSLPIRLELYNYGATSVPLVEVRGE